ncbi:MAG: HAD-IA family hydrolase [Acuticoccus sp.]
MQRCVMLDVDGVVVDGQPADGRPWASDIETDLGIAPDSLQRHFFTPHWDDIVTGRKSLAETLAGCLPLFAPSVRAETFIDYWFARDARIDPAVLLACDALRQEGRRVFLATNQEHLRAGDLMGRLGLAAHVDGIVHSAAVGARKPQRAFFEAAQRASGSAPHDTVLVDDNVANVGAARAAGWHAVHFRKADSLLEILAP